MLSIQVMWQRVFERQAFVMSVVVAFCPFANWNVVGQQVPEPAITEPAITAAHTNSGFVGGLDFPERPRGIQRFDKSDGSIGIAVVYQGVIYASKRDRTLHAIRVQDGKLLWKVAMGASITGVVCSRNKDNDLVFVSTDQGISGFRRQNGAQQFGRNIKLGVARATVVGDRVYAGGYDGHAYCFDAGGGNVLWRHNFINDAPQDPPGFDGDRARFGDQPARPRYVSCDGQTMVLSIFDQCRVIAVDCETGERQWDFRTQGWIYGRPTITDQYVLIGSQDKHFYCVDKSNGKMVWKHKTGSRIEAAGAVHKDCVYFGSCDATLYCANLKDGQIRWEYATEKRKKYGGPIYEQPFIGGDKVYLATMEGQIYALAADSGDLVWKLRPSNKSEIDGSLTDGERLFVTTRLNTEEKGEDALYVISP